MLLFIQRVLSASIDLMIIYLPSLFLADIILRQSSFSGLAAVLLFSIYNLAALSSFGGQTIGKHFAQLKVTAADFTFLGLSQRELTKILYFLPYAGFVFMLISVLIYWRQGKFLHDLVGRSEVILNASD